MKIQQVFATMNNKKNISNIIVSALALSAFTLQVPILEAAPATQNQAAGTRPNIIFILVDDMGWGDLNINWEYGEKFKNRSRAEKFKTPKLDKMAQEGMLLLRHYTACPVSAPARASLITGVHQGHARQVRDNTFDTPIEDAHTLGSVLQQAGYSTAVVGKWGVGGLSKAGETGATAAARPRERGFDFFYGLFDHLSGHYHYPANLNRVVWENETDVSEKLRHGNAYSTDLFTARAKQWIVDQKKNSPAKPFFLYLAYPAPHGSLRVPTCDYPSGGGVRGGVQWTGDTVNTAKMGKADSFIHPDNANFGNDAARRHSTMIRRVDDGIGDILKLLKDLKIDENTLVVFTSDNGPHNEAGNDSAAGTFYSSKSPAQNPAFFKSYGMMDGIKRDCFEGGLREPTIVRWPAQIAKKKTSTQPCQFQDWMATLADAAGVEIPSRSDGVSLLPTLTGKEKSQFPGQIYVEYSVGMKTTNYDDFASAHKNLIRRNQLVVWVDGYKGIARGMEGSAKLSGEGAVQFEIYDTQKDPQEIKNLAGTSSKFGEEMQQKFRDKALRSRRAFDGKRYSGFDFSDKNFLQQNPVPAVKISAASSGFNYKVFSQKKAFPWVPDFRQTHLPASSQGVFVPTSSNVIPPVATKIPGARGILLEGFLDVPANGEYVFYVTTDSNAGSKAFVHLHDIQLVDADKLYVPGTTADSFMNLGTENMTGTKKVHLAAGLHPIRIEYVAAESTHNPSLKLEWSVPGTTEKKLVPVSAIHRK